MTSDDLCGMVEPCRYCTEARRLLRAGWDRMTRQSSELRLRDMKQPPPHEQLHCGACEDRGVVLTERGRAVLGVLRLFWNQAPALVPGEVRDALARDATDPEPDPYA